MTTCGICGAPCEPGPTPCIFCGERRASQAVLKDLRGHMASISKSNERIAESLEFICDEIRLEKEMKTGRH